MSYIHKLDGNVLKVLRSQVSTVSLASAVTELVQNSIDAEATKVYVLFDIRTTSFMVQDNGKGMEPLDLDILGLHNMTSKIGDLRDLTELKTYGFRGEAVFCIANVSHFTIASKVKEYNSGRIRTLPNSSRIFDEKVLGKDSPLELEPFTIEEHGTRVMVEDLLYNTPVRRRIIQSEPAHKIHTAIKEKLFQLLVLHPELQLQVDYLTDSGSKSTLFASNNVRSQLTPHQKLSYVFLNTFGTIVPLESLRRVSVIYKKFKLNGIISRIAVRVKDYQLIYINGMEYHNASIQKMIANLFQTTLFENNSSNKTDVKSVGKSYVNHAVVVMDIRCPQSIDDLLQDRSKKLLLSSYADVLHPLILKVINSFLSHEGFTHSSVDGPTDHTLAKDPTSNSRKINMVLNSQIRMARVDDREIFGRTERNSHSVGINNKRLLPDRSQKQVKRKHSQPLSSTLARPYPLSGLSEPKACCRKLSTENGYEYSISRLQLASAEVVNQIGQKFILIKVWPERQNNDPMLVVVDQHASDERIKLETYLRDFLREVLSGTLQVRPITECNIDVSTTELELFEHFREEFFSWGICYRITISSDSSSLVVTSLPILLDQKFNGDKDYLKAVLQQMVHDMRCLKKIPIQACKKYQSRSKNDLHELSKYFNCIPGVFREILNSKACRSAIMFGDRLSKSECCILIRKLAECWLPFQCAHGRPSVVPLAQLRIFGEVEQPMSVFQAGFDLDYDTDEQFLDAGGHKAASGFH